MVGDLFADAQRPDLLPGAQRGFGDVVGVGDDLPHEREVRRWLRPCSAELDQVVFDVDDLAEKALHGDGFVFIQRRAAGPVLDLSLLQQRRFMGWLLAAAAMSAGFVGVLAFLPSYLRDPAGLTAAQNRLVMILPTLPMMLMPVAGSRLISHGTPPVLLITGALLAIAAGNGWLTILHPEVTPLGLAGPLSAVPRRRNRNRDPAQPVWAAERH